MAQEIDREAIEELFSLSFFKTGHNTVLVGLNGVGKTMILKNVALHALARGHTVRFSTASHILTELAAQDSSSILARRLRRYTIPQLLCIDEVGYLSYTPTCSSEVVTRSYEAQKPSCSAPTRPFSEWSEVFPDAACVVTLMATASRKPWGSPPPLKTPRQEIRVLAPPLTGELHRPRAALFHR